MKPATAIAEQVLQNMGSQPVNDAPVLQVDMDQHRKLVDALFERLTVLFPAGSPTHAQQAQHKAEWIKVLSLHGVLTSAAVQNGLMRARRDVGDRKFWPSPLQFVNWCRGNPEDHNMPSADDAFREAVRFYRQRKQHNWSHPVVYAAVHQVGSWAFSQSSEKELRAQFEHVYAQLVRRIIDGKPIDIDLPKALPAPGQSCRIASPDCPGRLRALQLLGRKTA